MKHMRRKGGFTLVEILVALSLLMLVVFCFTPLMLSSLKSVQMAGDSREEVQQGKTELELQFAQGVDDNAKSTAVIEFTQTGKTSKIGVAAGEYYQTTTTDRDLAGFATNSASTMSISPSEILETEATGGTRFVLYSDKVRFDELGNFHLVSKDYDEEKPYEQQPNSVKCDDLVRFSSGSDAHHAVMTVNQGKSLRYYDSKYHVIYDSLDAQLKVHIVPLVAVGEGGTVLIKQGAEWKDNLKAQYTDSRSNKNVSQIGSTNIQDIVWTGKQYALCGNSGLWAYSDSNGWAKKTNNSKLHIMDLDVSAEVGLLSTGYYHPPIGLWDQYAQQMKSPAEMEYDAPLFKSGKVGFAVTAGVTGQGKAVPLWLYTYSGRTYAETPNAGGGNALYEGDAKAVESNGKSGKESEFLAAIAQKNKSMDLRAIVGANNESALCDGDNWQSITSQSNPGGTVTKKRIHFYLLQNYKDGNTVIRVETEPGTAHGLVPVQSESNKKDWYVTYNGEEIFLTNGDKHQFEDVEYFDNGGLYSMTGKYNDIYYADEQWLIGGKINFNANTGTVVTIVKNTKKPENVGKWAGKGNGGSFLYNSADVEYFVDRDNITMTTEMTPIVYRTGTKITPAVIRGADGKVLSQTALEQLTINGINQIGGRYYAVGDGGVILISDDGRDWRVERANQSSAPALYAVAGTGEYVQ